MADMPERETDPELQDMDDLRSLEQSRPPERRADRTRAVLIGGAILVAFVLVVVWIVIP